MVKLSDGLDSPMKLQLAVMASIGEAQRKDPIASIKSVLKAGLNSSNDEPHVELIVKLLKEMGFNQDKVFCSTIPGYGIGLSKDFYNTLLNLFNEHDLYVIFVHSPNYYGSAVGLNEMGAAWVLKSSLPHTIQMSMYGGFE